MKPVQGNTLYEGRGSLACRLTPAAIVDTWVTSGFWESEIGALLLAPTTVQNGRSPSVIVRDSARMAAATALHGQELP